MAILNLEGPAADWLDTVGSLETLAWPDFREGIQERFGKDPQDIIDKLTERRQGPHEDVRAFTDDCTRLLARADATCNSIPGKLQLKGFIDALRQPVRSLVCWKHPSTLAEAIREAKYLEANASKAKTNTAFMLGGTPAQKNVRFMEGMDAAAATAFPGPPTYSQAPHAQSRDRRPDYRQDRREPPPPRRDGNANGNANNGFDKSRRDGGRMGTWPPRGHDNGYGNRNNSSSTSVEALTKKIGEMEIKMAEFSGEAQFNIHELYDYDSYHDDDLRAFDALVNDYDNDVEMEDAQATNATRPRNRMGFNPDAIRRQRPTDRIEPRQPRGATAGPQRQGFDPTEVQRRLAARRTETTAATSRPTGTTATPPVASQSRAPATAQATPAATTAPSNVNMPRLQAAQRRPAGTKAPYSIVDHLGSTAAKISNADLLKVSPWCRRKMQDYLGHCEQLQHQISVNYHDAANDWSSDIDVNAHQPAAHVTMSDDAPMLAPGNHVKVVKAQVIIKGQRVSAIVDSGATHCMMTDVLAKKLLLWSSVRPTSKG